MSDLRPGDHGLAVSAVVANLERRHGHARLLSGDEARRTAAALGCWHRCHVINVGGGVLYTVGPRGGGLRRHDPDGRSGMSVCEFCADVGTVIVAVGPVDPFGVPDGTVEAPCPYCPAGDAEAEHRIGRSWHTPSQASPPQGPLDSTGPRRGDPGTAVESPSCPGGDVVGASRRKQAR